MLSVQIFFTLTYQNFVHKLHTFSKVFNKNAKRGHVLTLPLPWFSILKNTFSEPGIKLSSVFSVQVIFSPACLNLVHPNASQLFFFSFFNKGYGFGQFYLDVEQCTIWVKSELSAMSSVGEQNWNSVTGSYQDIWYRNLSASEAAHCRQTLAEKGQRKGAADKSQEITQLIFVLPQRRHPFV